MTNGAWSRVGRGGKNLRRLTQPGRAGPCQDPVERAVKVAKSLWTLAAEQQAAGQKGSILRLSWQEELSGHSCCNAVFTGSLYRCEEAAGDDKAWHDKRTLSFHLPERNPGGPEASVHQLLCLF